MDNLKNEEDQYRGGITLTKILQLFRLFHPKNTKTLARIDKFSDLDIKKINKIKNLDIKGIILDVDDCIAYNHGDILEENIKHIKKLKSEGIKIMIYSNMKKTSRYKVIENYVDILTNLPAKPDIEGFQYALKTIEIKPKNLVMVGDNYITDGGAINLGIPFIKVKPIKTRYRKWGKKLLMTGYSYLRSFYNFVSKIHDLFREKPLKSKDFK